MFIIIKERILFSLFCDVIVSVKWHRADAIIYERCFDLNDDMDDVTLNECSTGFVIRIESAELGHARIASNGSCWRATNCESASQSTTQIEFCNGQRRCSFPFDTLYTLYYSLEYCSEETNEHFLSIAYNCVKSNRNVQLICFCCTTDVQLAQRR